MKNKYYGLLDTKDLLWLGDESGPVKYTEKDIAKIAAQVIDVRMGWEPGRTRATRYRNKTFKIRDEVKASTTTLEALHRIERGAAL